MKDVNLLTSNGVNIQQSLELFGDMETYNETLKDFLDTVDEKLENIKKYKETSDMTNYAILVHSLKSDSKYLGFTKLAELSYQHEMESKANNLGFVYDNYDELMTEAKRILVIVKKYMGQEVVEEVKQVETVKDKAILVVDDSNLIRNLIKKIFDDEYEILMASDGKIAIDTIVRNPNNSNIVGMLLDLNMPGVNGYEVLEYLHSNNLFTKIPVSIITGVDGKDEIEKVFMYPIVDVLSKPFNERDVKRVVEKTVNYMK